MKTIYQSNLFILSSSLMIFFLVATGCAPVEIKKVTVLKAADYKFRSENAGLNISVDPFREENRLKVFFGCDLLSRGILPVLVVIENQNAKDGYILVKEGSALVAMDPAGKDTESNLLKGDYDSKELRDAINTAKATQWLGFATAIVPVLALPAVIGGAASTKGEMDEFEIKRNIEANHLLDKTVYQGTSHSGFVYFQLKSKEDINRMIGFRFKMKNIRSDESLSFIININ